MGDPYQQYYYRQAYGSGSLPVFHGVAIQKGHGLGNLLNAGLRMLLPGIKSVGKAVLSQGVDTGVNILSDVISGKSATTAAKRRALEGGENLMNRALAQVGLVGTSAPKKRRRKAVGRGSRRGMYGAGLRGKKKTGGRRSQLSGGVRRRKRAPAKRRRGVAKRRVIRKRRRVSLGQDIFS